ncbi:hypothetical protein B6A42_23940 [Vibrio coralliilyticus]|nr:hypothetical protein B6A42_23940 [Vibrio coralliilyticus]
MIIVYGYYKDEPMELIGKTLDQQGTFIAAKPIGRIDNRLTFAALVDSPDPFIFQSFCPTAFLLKNKHIPTSLINPISSIRRLWMPSSAKPIVKNSKRDSP